MLNWLSRIFPEPPIFLGEAVAVPIIGDDGFQYIVAGIVSRLYGNGMADVYVLQAPNAPHCRRMRVLTRGEVSEGETGENIAWRV